MAPVTESLGVVGGYILFWVLFLIAFALFSQRAYQLYRLLMVGQADNRFDQVWRRLWKMASTIVLQVCNLKSVTRTDRAGLGHTFIFWGFLLFLLSYVLYIGFGGGFGLHKALGGNVFQYGFFAVLDIMAAVIIVAIIWAAIRRYVVRPARLELSLEAGVIMLLILMLMVCHYFVEAFAINVAEPALGSWALVSNQLAKVFNGASVEAQTTAHDVVWWIHYAIILSFLIYVPRSKHLHIIGSPFNAFFSSLKPKGSLRTIDLEATETYGVSRIQHFTWKQLLDGYACAVCGRCDASCPAYLSDKPLSPKDLIHNLKEHLLEHGPALIKGGNGDHEVIGSVISEDAIWACTTCRSCQQECPVLNEHIDKIVDLRRHLVLEEGRFPETAMGALKSMETRGHPWRGTMASRMDWAGGLGLKEMSEDSDVDILYWVGCTAALEDRNMKVAQALAKLLKAAGVRFGILGTEEMCCGEPARRIGNEYLFQMMAQQNIETLKRYNVRKIVTSCPHCFNTIKHEYPEFGGDFEVLHHSQMLAQLLKNGKLKLSGRMDKVTTYQDSCYLGRYNDIYKPPRDIMASVPGVKLVEMERRGKRNFCCGGGGGRMWMEEDIGKRINNMRTEEILSTNAEMVVSPCPYCLQMFEDGIKALGAEEKVRALDLAELLEKAL